MYKLIDNKVVFLNVEDYNLDETFLCGQAFRWDKYKDGFSGFINKTLCYVYFDNSNLIVEPLVVCNDLNSFAKKCEKFLSLDIDYKMLKERFSKNEIMKKSISYAPGIRVLNQDFFETLLTFIISQNNNIPRIKKIVDELSKNYGEKVGDFYSFPTAESLKNISIEEYAQLKMGFRAKYIFDAVQKINDGEIKEETLLSLSYEDAQTELIKIKGVGPKVADCVLLFSLEKYESFPKDVWINRALEQMFPNGLPKEIKGYEGIAQQYIFHYARNNLEK